MSLVSTPRPLRLFAPEAAPADPRAQDYISCARPSVQQSRATARFNPSFRPEFVGASGPSVDELLRRMADEHRPKDRVVPVEDRDRVRRGTLLQFWDEFVRPDRERALAADEIAKGTLDKERQTIAQFEAWNATQRPAKWPPDLEFPGQSLGNLDEFYLAKWVADQKSRCAEATVEPRWFHLRTVLNAAVEMNVLERCPTVAVKPPRRKRRGAVPVIDDLCATQYQEAELSSVYAALASFEHAVEHQVAWAVGANAGPRTEDLYGLLWHVNVRLEESPPFLIYVAQKTGKTHWVPLAPVTVAQLRRLAAGRLCLEGPVFPALSGHCCKDPGRSRAARRRTSEVKAALEAAGIKVAGDYRKPIQVLRSTCNSRMKNHRPGVGHLLTHGPDYSDVNEKFYDDWRPRIIEAVMTLQQPEAFTP